MSEIEYLKSCIRDVPNFPQPGVLFKDITPLLNNVQARALVLDLLCTEYQNKKIDAVAAIEARGFLFGMLLAERLAVPFIPIRKAGKLPYVTKSTTYELEYGSATIEVHADAVSAGSRVLIHDDVLATGGTASAAAKLIQEMGATVIGFSFIINLTFLSGDTNLKTRFGVEQHSLLTF